MSNGQWTPQEETRLAEYFVARVCERASGRAETECLRNYPRDIYFVGNLRPRPIDLGEAAGEPAYMRELRNKLAPMAFGAEFLVRPLGDESEINVRMEWACYYRVFPTLAQQRQHLGGEQGETGEAGATSLISVDAGRQQETLSQNDELALGEAADDREQEAAEADSPEVAESAADRRRRRIPSDSMFIRFRKIPCRAAGIVRLRLQAGVWIAEVGEFQADLDREMLRAQQIAMDDPERIRTAGAADEKLRVPETALASDADFSTFRRSLRNDVFPQWRWEVRGELRLAETDDPVERIVAVEFVNVSPMTENPPNMEPFLFDCHAGFGFPADTVRPFELEMATRSFRYDRTVWGRGLNCAVERQDAQTFLTTAAPIYRQMRFVTQMTPSARFDELAENPLPTLRTILGAMEDYRGQWDNARRHYVASDSTWEAAFGIEFDLDRAQFGNEVERFRAGCEMIRTNADVRLAFQLTNEAFRRGRNTNWRLFQIVFVVSQIAGIAALGDPNGSQAEREVVDVIYFPTGGGKTEAYLGTIVLHCFFDRLRGKTAGVTCWTRFPLRLLTLQQTQRVADVIGVAEIVRREQTDVRLSGRDVDGFAVGYFVGAEATPNELIDPTNYSYAKAPDQVNWSKANDPVARQSWQRVIRCPACQTNTVQVDFDPASVRVIHRCTEPNCRFPEGVVPVFVVDNEIYRYLPSVIVGTIDKLAGIGNQRKLAQVFGQVDGRCSVHGYYKGKCTQKDCSGQRRLQPRRPNGLSGPTLFVQDELHLLKEGLGTFDAHYETFTQQIRREFGERDSLKIIASSATIEAFQRQVEHLYGRTLAQARVFPGPGPTLGRSFYAETLDYPQRLFVGLIPHNKTIFNTILELLELFHCEAQSLARLAANEPNPYGGTLLPGTAAWQALLDFYVTSLTYFLSGRELNSIRTDLNGDVNPNLQADGLLPLDISELTSGVGTDEVTRILENLERSGNAESRSDAILATSMVSHGVDVDRLNTMIFYGMPRQNAEYIQASSRVGRSCVGVIFMCLHPARERDQSHYTYFVKYHEFLGQLVEPVALNRWAKFSINRTLPGLFMGVLLQLLSNRAGADGNRFYMLDFIKQRISDGTIRAADFIPLLERAYGVSNPVSPREQVFRDEIGRRIPQFLDQIIGAGPSSRFVSAVLIPPPLTSLRDVDEPVSIELDNAGTQWAGAAEQP